MTAGPSIDLSGWLDEQLAQASPDPSAGHGQYVRRGVDGRRGRRDLRCAVRERSAKRTNKRNDYHDRDWDTRAGSIELAIPKLRPGSYLPTGSWSGSAALRRRWSAWSRPAICWAFRHVGWTGWCTRSGSPRCRNRTSAKWPSPSLDAQVEPFRTRPLDAGPYTFVAADGPGHDCHGECHHR